MKPFHTLPDDELLTHMRAAVRALPDAPATWQRSAMGLWNPAVAQGPWRAAAAAVRRQLTAAMSFDSWAGSSLATGMRSMPSATRHLLFSTHGRDVDLRIAPVAEGFNLAGQILGPDDAGHILLAAAGGASHEAALDALGEFRLEGVQAGTYSLTLRLGADEISLPPIEVGGEHGK